MSTLKVNRFENTSGVGYGAVIQTVNTQTGAVATTATTTPVDDTIPQITEGAEFMTLAITPKSATSKLKISVLFNGTISANAIGTVALFQDSTANALATTAFIVPVSGNETQTSLIHYMTSGTTSSTTFRVRAGPNSGTLTFNGTGGARLYGGTYASSITIEEIQV